MKKYLTLFLLLFALAASVPAQAIEKSIEKIRLYYADITAKANAAEATEGDDLNEAAHYGELIMNELNINQLNHEWRAVGVYALTYKFFYTGGDSEAHLYPDELVKVVVVKRISARVYTQEFLYDKKGALIFYFQKAENEDAGQGPAERRVYFSLGKTIRVIEDGKTRDKLNVKDAATVKEIMQDSLKIKSIFNQSINL